MTTTFYIDFSFKTGKGPEGFARFFIGNDREAAYALFQELWGTEDVDEKNILYIDFMELVSGLPVNIKMKSCTLNQLAENCRIITKELFRLNSMDSR